MPAVNLIVFSRTSEVRLHDLGEGLIDNVMTEDNGELLSVIF